MLTYGNGRVFSKHISDVQNSLPVDGISRSPRLAFWDQSGRELDTFSDSSEQGIGARYGGGPPGLFRVLSFEQLHPAPKHWL